MGIFDNPIIIYISFQWKQTTICSLKEITVIPMVALKSGQELNSSQITMKFK